MDDASRGRLDQDQLDWLQNTLSGYQNLDNRIVVMHVPPFDPRNPGDGHAMDEKKADALMSILKKGHVTQIFASHIHGYFHGQWEGIPYWISGGAGARLAGDDPNHYFFHYLQVKADGPHVTAKVIRLHVGSGIGWGRIPYEAKRWLRNWAYFKHVSLALIIALIALLAIHLSALRAWNSSRRSARP